MAEGYRGLLAPWVGGASAEAAPPVGEGYRSFLAFWSGGGATFGEFVAPVEPAAPVGGGGGGKKRRVPRYYYEPEEVREVVKAIRKRRRLPETLDPGDVVQIAQQVAQLSNAGKWNVNAAIRDLTLLEVASTPFWRSQIAEIRAALQDDEEALILLLGS